MKNAAKKQQHQTVFQQFNFVHLKSLQHTDVGSQNQLKFSLNGSDSTHRKVFFFLFLTSPQKYCVQFYNIGFSSNKCSFQNKQLSLCMCSQREETLPCIESLAWHRWGGTLQQEEEKLLRSAKEKPFNVTCYGT